MTEQYGAGIKLDQNLDLTVSEIGDIGTVNGLDELEKDLSFQLNFTLRRFLGEKPTNNLKARVRNVTKQVVELDTRVRRFDERVSEVRFPDRRSETISITAPIVTESGEQFELVFEVQ